MAEECIFCNIVNGKTDTQFLYRDDRVVAFADIHPHAPVHDLIVPFQHIRSVNDLQSLDQELMAHMVMTGRELARQRGVDQSGYKLLFNVEWGGGQRIFHIHMHLLGGWDKEK
ncbi:MAG: HIT family hydrolase [Deltaproteobacteria bacterium SG8_13]|nr:MAG: HIT family hydrolase [Deltaproteobacteria bacterium SG8_13]